MAQSRKGSGQLPKWVFPVIAIVLVAVVAIVGWKFTMSGEGSQGRTVAATPAAAGTTPK